MITGIKSKYCTDKKVQVMFSNATRQIILSKDGYLYLREDGIETIHRYLDDPIREKMPYRKQPPTTKAWAKHLFEYYKIYAKFTKDRSLGEYSHDSFSLTFLYFIKAENGEAIWIELEKDYFEAEETTETTFSKNELKKFLFSLDTDTTAKFIFEWFYGIRYAEHRNEDVLIKDDNFIPISDDEIINKFNSEKEIFSHPLFSEKLEMDEERVSNISDISDFVLTYHGILANNFSPMLLVVKGEKMYLYDFKVIFVTEDCFKVETIKRTISFTPEYIQKIIENGNCQYAFDP